MKTYTVTYCEWTSYGSILQALGLQKTIKKLDVENSILKQKKALSYKYKNPKLKSVKPAIVASWLFKQIIAKKIAKRYYENLAFIDKNIDIEYAESYDKILTLPLKADCFIAGSDQIWHPDLCIPLFFLDFVKDNTKKIAYAASMGKTTIPKDKEQEFSRLIKNFDTISVREKDNADIVKNFTEKEVSVNIDPTFLLSKEEWRKYESEYKIKKPYILIYTIYWDKELNKQVKQLSKKTGLKVVNISASLDKVFAHKKVYDADVSQFLWLIDNAEYVITSSFHGVAFSTIFNKKFSAVVNPKMPSRIANLTELLSIPIIPIEKLSQAEEFDYKKINKKIEEQKQASLAFLKKELKI